MTKRLDWRRVRPGQRIHKADEPIDWLTKRASQAMRKWVRTLNRRDRRWLESGGAR